MKVKTYMLKNNNYNIRLVDFLIFILVLLSELPRIYTFSQVNAVNVAINLLQIPCYLGIVFLIIRKRYSLKILINYAVILAILFIGYMFSGQAAFFRGGMLILATRDYPYKRIVRTSRYAITSVFTLALFLWITGLSDAGIARRGGIAFGYVHPNIAAQVIMIIILLWLVEKGRNIKKRDYAIFELIVIFVFVVTKSRTATLIVAMAPIIIEITKRIYVKKSHRKISVLLLQCSQLIMFFFTCITAMKLPDSNLLKILDLALSNRLFLNYYLLNKFPLKLFGQNVNLTESDVYNNIQNIYGAAVTCDCTYTLSLIIMGLIPTVLFCLGYVLIIKKALKNNNYIILATCILLTAYAFCESQMVEIYNYFVYFYIFAKDDMEIASRERKKSNGGCYI